MMNKFYHTGTNYAVIAASVMAAAFLTTCGTSSENTLLNCGYRTQRYNEIAYAAEKGDKRAIVLDMDYPLLDRGHSHLNYTLWRGTGKP